MIFSLLLGLPTVYSLYFKVCLWLLETGQQGHIIYPQNLLVYYTYKDHGSYFITHLPLE